MPITNLPPQPGAVAYGPATEALPVLAGYAHPGGMVAASRGNYNDRVYHDIAAAGGHVLIYLDPIVHNPGGRYHDFLFNASTFGAAVPKWPGPIPANSTGDLADFRVGGVLLSKLEAVLELMVAENPHMAGWFIDDCGSRSWFPLFDWATFGAQNQADYRAGAIAVCQTVRTVADRYGLIFLVNGTWTSGTLAANGGGYPLLTTHGMSLADGGVVEHHDTEVAFWGPYMDQATQWADASPVTAGKAFHFSINDTSAGVTAYRTDGRAAWVSQQTAAQYDGVAPWGTVSDFHATGLPSGTGVTGPNPVRVSASSRAAGFAGNAASMTWTCPAPTRLAEGNYLLAFSYVATSSTLTGLGLPAGFTPIGALIGAASSGGWMQVGAKYVTAAEQASPPANYTFSGTAGASVAWYPAAAIVQYSGVVSASAVDDFDSALSAASTTTHTAPSLDISDPPSKRVDAFGAFNPAAISSWPANMADATHALSGGNEGLYVFDQAVGAVGSTGTRTVTSSANDRTCAASVALKGADPPPTPPTAASTAAAAVAATTMRTGKWRYLAQQALTGEVLDLDLPIKREELRWDLSAAGVFRGTIAPEWSTLKWSNGAPVLEEWETFLYAELDGRIMWGGILQTSGFRGPEWALEAYGFTSYASELPYLGVLYSHVDRDPTLIFSDIWAYIQAQPDGNLGLTVTRPTNCPVRKGTAEEPYRLVWHEAPDLGSELSQLAAETPFDFTEAHAWAGPNASAPYRAALSAQLPIGWWALEEVSGTVAADYAGTNPGTYTGGPTLGMGGLAPYDTPNRSTLFANTALRYVQIPDAVALNPASFSVTALVDSSGINGNNRIAAKGLLDGGWALKYEGTNNLQLHVFSRVTVNYTLADTGRHHLAGTYDAPSGVGRLYVDGALVASVTGTAGAAPVTTGEAMRIAQKPGGTVNGDGWNGKIQHVALFNRPLLAAEVALQAAQAGLGGSPTVQGEAITHAVTVAYPRAGRRRTDLVFNQDNLAAVPELERPGGPFSNAVYVFGKGEGHATVHGEAVVRDGRLRRAKVHTDKLAATRARCNAIAAAEQRRRTLGLALASIVVNDHPNAPIGSWQTGDDITVSAVLPHVGPVNLAHRIIGWSLGESDTQATLHLARSDIFRYGAT